MLIKSHFMFLITANTSSEIGLIIFPGHICQNSEMEGKTGLKKQHRQGLNPRVFISASNLFGNLSHGFCLQEIAEKFLSPPPQITQFICFPFLYKQERRKLSVMISREQVCESCYLNGGVGADVTMASHTTIWETTLAAGIPVGRITRVPAKKTVI